jgi:HSP20 family protein
VCTAFTVDPFQGLRFFEDAVTRLINEPRTNRPWSPPVDILETEDAVTVNADLPDVKTEDIDIRVENGTMTLRGARKFEKDENVRGYHRIERSFREFVRSFALPPTVEADKVSAEYKNGVLTITLRRRKRPSPARSRSKFTDRNVGQALPPVLFPI